MDVSVGLERSLSAQELMLSKCGAGEDLKSPLNNKEIRLVDPKGNQALIFIGRTDVSAEAETPILWPPNVKK